MEARSGIAALGARQATGQRLFLATGLAGLTAAGAKLSVHLPYTPVPITLQLLFVLLAGGLLGPLWGTVSQLEYLGAGLAGLPVFAGPSAGPAALLTPSGGYLLGFVAGAWAVGLVCRQARGRPAVVTLGMAAGVMLVYAFGATWPFLALGRPWSAGIALGVLPFLGVDAAKAALATVVVTGTQRHAHDETETK